MGSNLDRVDIVILVSAIVCLVAVALVKLLLFFVGLLIITRGQQNLAFLVGVNEGQVS